MFLSPDPLFSRSRATANLVHGLLTTH